MKKPVLVVMAAGMGSRYGGLKQIDPVGPTGELIIDYSIYDAKRAGFETVVFVIKHEIEEIFKNAIGNRLSKVIEVKYVYQELSDLPDGYTAPAERVKPWGTAHAILAARNIVDGPFAVINADDYYGPEAFRKIYNYLCEHSDDSEFYEFAMVGYRLDNTLTEHGHVARGICVEDNNHFLISVTEHTHIEKDGANARFTEDDGETWAGLPGDSVVSMNLWGLTHSFMDEAWNAFPAFLDVALTANPAKAEYFLPGVVSALISDGKARAKVLKSNDKWHGVTYQEDKPAVVKAIKEKVETGLYPEELWG